MGKAKLKVRNCHVETEMGSLKSITLASSAILVAVTQCALAGETLKLGRVQSAGSFDYGIVGTYMLAVRDLYPVDLDNDGNEEVILAGFESAPNSPETFDKTLVRIFGWSNGKLVNQTSKWLPGDAAVVEGVGDVAIGDFNGDGLKDFFTTAYSDMNYPVYEYSFVNKGGYFEKVQYAQNTWEHGSTVADINHDGFDDVIVLGYRTSPYLLGSPNGLIRYIPYESWQFGSDIAAGHFISPSDWSFVEVDSSGIGISGTDTILRSLRSYGDNIFGFDAVSGLPLPIMGQYSHDVRAIPFNLNNDGLDDTIVFSRAAGEGNNWPEHSTVQLLLNKGSGQFEDITNTNLIGFQAFTSPPYHPIVADINSDGLMDIFISGSDWWGTSNSNAFLMGRPNGYLAENFRAQLSRRNIAGFGSVSTLVKTNAGYYLVSERQNPNLRNGKGKKARVKYMSISVQ